MVGLKADIQLSNDEDEKVKEVLNKYGWQPKEWGGAFTGGYSGFITVGGAKIRAHLHYGLTADLALESDNPRAEKLLMATELSSYLDRAKIKRIVDVQLSGKPMEQALQKLKENGWRDEPQYGGMWDIPKRVHELTPFNIQGQQFRAEALGPRTRDSIDLRLYSVADESLALKSLKNSDLAEILSMSKS
jgi:hypothetical protein